MKYTWVFLTLAVIFLAVINAQNGVYKECKTIDDCKTYRCTYPNTYGNCIHMAYDLKDGTPKYRCYCSRRVPTTTTTTEYPLIEFGTEYAGWWWFRWPVNVTTYHNNHI